MAMNNQGVIAVVPPFNYCEVEHILEVAKQKNEDPFVLILDGIEDPHNLGSIIRTAETAGVHGIIIPKRRNVQVNSTVVKVSTGATNYVKVARVNNLNETIRKLKEAGLWIIGTDGEAKTLYYNQDLKGPLAFIIVVALFTGPDKSKDILLDEGNWTYSMEGESVVVVEITDGNHVTLTAKRDGNTFIRFEKADGTEQNYYVTVSGGSIWINLLDEE